MSFGRVVKLSCWAALCSEKFYVLNRRIGTIPCNLCKLEPPVHRDNLTRIVSYPSQIISSNVSILGFIMSTINVLFCSKKVFLARFADTKTSDLIHVLETSELIHVLNTFEVVSKLRICRHIPPPPQKWPSRHKRFAMS